MKRSGPLKRSGSLKRSSGLKRSGPIRYRQKPNASGSDPAHLAWVREQPCAVCGTTRGVEAHHPRQSDTGMGRKAPDREAFPLCYRHHRLEFHLARGFCEGWSKAQRHEWQRQMSARYAPEDQVV